MIRFEVLGQPQPQGSTRAFVNKKTGRAIVTSSNPNLKSWRDSVAWSAREAMAGAEPSDGPVCLQIAFWMPRPKSVKRQEPTVKPDLDKLVRGVLDGLTGIVYRDDAQVTRVDATKRYVDPAVPNPITAITVFGDE